METKVELYKAYLEDLGRIGGRHENVRKFYVSVISALFVFLAMAGKEGVLINVRGPVLAVVGIVGILICLAWLEHMRSFGALYGAKLATLRSLEEQMDSKAILKPFTAETRLLEEARAGKTDKAAKAAKAGEERKWRYSPITLVDRFVPVGCLALFLALVAFKLFDG